MVHTVFLYYLEGNSLGKQHPWYSGRAFLYFKRLRWNEMKGFHFNTYMVLAIYVSKPLSRVPFEYGTLKWSWENNLSYIYIWLYTKSPLLKTYIPRYVFKQFSMYYLMPLEVFIYLYKCSWYVYIISNTTLLSKCFFLLFLTKLVWYRFLPIFTPAKIYWLAAV